MNKERAIKILRGYGVYTTQYLLRVYEDGSKIGAMYYVDRWRECVQYDLEIRGGRVLFYRDGALAFSLSANDYILVSKKAINAKIIGAVKGWTRTTAVAQALKSLLKKETIHD